MKAKQIQKILSGTALAFLLSAGAVAAQTTTTPATPETGVGGTSTVNLALLAASATIALGGAMLLARKRTP